MNKLYDFQEECVRTLLSCPNRHIVIAEPGLGKGATSITWAYEKAKETGKSKLLVITTASKVKVHDALKRNDFEQDADNFVGEDFHKVFHEFKTVSWDTLYKWVNAHKKELSQWIFIADEVQKSKGAISSRRGKAFLKLTQATSDWTGYTATPGDMWIDYLAYFLATKRVRNKTQFMREFCQVQTFKGFPEIVGYNHVDTLRKWWGEISYAPDTRKMLSELPKANYVLTYVSKPRGYAQVLKMRQKLCADGTLSEDYEDFLDNPSATAHYLRQMCFTDEKRQWVKDFLEGLGEQCIIFYNYVSTGDAVEEIAKKVLPEGAKVWRIDGETHEIPNKETMGDRDIVLAQWRSGAEGLNLQFMRVWVAVELQYSYSTQKQAKGRVMRIGQDRPVFYYALVAKGTIEEDVLKCIQTKQDFAEKTWLLGQKLMKEEDDR